MKLDEIKEFLKEFPLSEKEIIKIATNTISEINTHNLTKRGTISYVGKVTTYKQSMKELIFRIRTNTLIPETLTITVKGSAAVNFEYKFGDEVRVEFDLKGEYKKVRGKEDELVNGLLLTRIEKK